ncbi:MAG: porin [Chromatiaceae bacterium]|nr:porin [Chromatiaceae bacterium]
MMHNTQARRSLALLSGLAALAVQTPSLGSGFYLPESSAAGLGTANAMVANPDLPGAISYNAAAMGFHDSSSLAIGGLLIGPSFSVETASGSHDSQGADWAAAPMLQAALALDERWRLGFGLHVPFGLETRWRDGTFPAVSGTATLPVPPPLDPEVPLGHPVASKLEVLDLATALAYRVNEQLSLAAGVDLYWGKQAKLSSTAGSLTGEGSGLGFNLSALYRQGSWSLGASFHSAATLGLEGDFTATSPTLVALGVSSPSQPGKIDFDLPWRLQLGVRYAVNPRLAVEFDWTRTGWSKFETLDVRALADDSPIFNDTNAWDDANAWRFGLTYQWTEATQLRLGYAYDETGQGDDHFSARIPDNNRHLFSLGFAHHLAPGLSVEGGYMYVLAEDRDYRATTPYTGSDLNGTTALDGDYAMDAHLIGLELVKVF